MSPGAYVPFDVAIGLVIKIMRGLQVLHQKHRLAYGNVHLSNILIVMDETGPAKDVLFTNFGIEP